MFSTFRLAPVLALVALPVVAQDRDTVVATVNGTDITLGQMIITRAQLPPQYQQLPDEALFEGVLDQLIQQQLLADTIAEAPARVSIALQNERRTLLAGEAVNDVMEGAATEEEIAARYAEEFEQGEPVTEWNAAHILVETEEEAVAARQRIEQGADFAAVAAELSQDPGSGSNGGALGWFGPGMMVPEFEAAVAELEVGELSQPVQTDFGWHILSLNETRLQTPPALQEISGEIAGQLQQEALEARLAELLDGATIDKPEAEIDPAILKDLSLLD